METLIATFVVVGISIAIMSIGLLKGKPVRKDCGLDPVTGERISDCACAATGRKTCDGEGQKPDGSCEHRQPASEKVIPLREGF